MSIENLKCPDCKGSMIPRTNHREGTKFWGCKDFPKCKGTRDSMGLSKEDRDKEFKGEKEDGDTDESKLPSDRYKGSRRYQ